MSLVAERAVRYLSGRAEPVGSIEMVRQLLATRASDENTARRVLEAAFGSDPRLYHDGTGWRTREPAPSATPGAAGPAPPRTLLLMRGRRARRGQPFELTALAAVRIEENDVVGACGGEPSRGKGGTELRESVLGLLDGAIPVLHDPPGALSALERWLEEPLEAPVSLRIVAQRRLSLPADHDLEALAARLGLSWRDADDLLDQAEVLEACLEKLRLNGESLSDLRVDNLNAPRIDWFRFAFDRRFLRELPRVAGTYRFYDANGGLLYVGKSKNLHRRIASYFREGAPRTFRVQRLLDALHRIEVEPVGSDLEALLREAALIRGARPGANVQRDVRPRSGSYRERLRSVLILEPAVKPWVLRAYLLHDGTLLGKVNIGSRGAGLKRIERLLDDHFFGVPIGPTLPEGPTVEVEVVSRWLAGNRDRAVAFDPTDLGSSREVVDRLRWFLKQGSLSDPEGTPIRTR